MARMIFSAVIRFPSPDMIAAIAHPDGILTCPSSFIWNLATTGDKKSARISLLLRKLIRTPLLITISYNINRLDRHEGANFFWKKDIGKNFFQEVWRWKKPSELNL